MKNMILFHETPCLASEKRLLLTYTFLHVYQSLSW